MSKFDEVQKRLDERTIPLHEQHRQEVRRTFKLDAERPQEDREKLYMEKVYPKYEGAWTEAAQDFVHETVQLQNELEERAYGKPDPSHLIGLANVPNEKLEEVLTSAQSAGDESLQRSVIAIARQRGERGLVNKWVESDADRKAAAQELKAIPELERLEPIAKGRRVPRAGTETLAPDREAIEEQVSKNAADEASRAAFFNRPRRMVGRRSDYV